MAMKMTGEMLLPADKPTVWAGLNDAETLKACIPGCESFEKTSDTEFQAVAKVKIGPVSARFRGKVNLTDIDAPNSYRISGEGEGGVAGFAKGGAVVTLADAGSGTTLVYDVDATVGGKIAQLGGRLINGTAKKLADEFFANFAKRLSPDQEEAPQTVSAGQDEAAAVPGTPDGSAPPGKKGLFSWLKRSPSS